MVCFICDAQDWRKLDLHRQIPMQVCKRCGLLCHDVEPQDENKLKAYYRNEYKPVLGPPAIITAGNKLNYVAKFLEPFLADKKGLLCADVGAATGYIPNYLRSRGHRVTGSEWTLANRRLCEALYGIPLAEDLPEKQYDLLSMYHVLEHLVEPDKKLRRYAGMLADGGHMFVSTPEWLSLLHEASGSPLRGGPNGDAQSSFENLFHKNHINLFTERSLKNLFGKVGLMVVQEDRECYGQTYLMKRGAVKPYEPEDWQQIEFKVRKQREAMELYFRNQFAEAVKVWPPFPEAWIGLIFGAYGKDPERQNDMLSQVDRQARNSWRFMSAEAQWLAKQDRLEEALRLCDRVCQVRFMVDILYMMGELLTRMGRHREAMMTFMKCAQMQPHRWMECWNWVIHNATKIPTWDEKGLAEAQKMLMEQAMAAGDVRITPPEPVGLEKPKEG